MAPFVCLRTESTGGNRHNLRSQVIYFTRGAKF